MQKLKLKKILTIISTLAIVTPASLSIIACNDIQWKNSSSNNEKITTLNDKITALIQISSNILYAGTNKGIIWEINLLNKEKTIKYKLDTSSVSAIKKLANGNLIILTSSGSLWHISNNNEKKEIKIEKTNDEKNSTYCFLEVSNNKLLIGGFGVFYRLDLKLLTVVRTFKFPRKEWITSLNYLYNGNKDQVLVAGKDGYVGIFSNGLIGKTSGFVLENTKITTLIKSNNENKCYVGTSGGKILEVDLKTQSKIEILQEDSSVLSLLLSKSDNSLYISSNNTIKKFNLETKKTINKSNIKDDSFSFLTNSYTNSNELYAGTNKGKVLKIKFN